VELCRDGTPVKMREQSFLILVYLLEHAGEIVTREELSRVLWPSDTFVDFYHGLNMAVMTLRDALGDSSEAPLYIETIPKHGYRFIAPVSAVGYRVVLLEEDSNSVADNRSLPDSPYGRSVDAAMPTPAASADSHLDVADDSAPAGRRIGAGAPNRRLGRFRLLLLAASILAAGFATAVWYLHLPLPPPRISHYFQITHDGYDKMPVGTDGSRVYYNQVSPLSILQVATSGGMIAPTQVSVPGGGRLNLLDVSPDGANLLIGQQVPGDAIGALWNVRVLGGSARRLGAAIFAVFSPDGNSIAYVPKRGEIWLVRSDGSGAHKLVSMSGNSNSLSIAYCDLVSRGMCPARNAR
jgi:DNA-binding winged helix-turn-helix (wHTH) protein